jgi:hypothetical protein
MPAHRPPDGSTALLLVALGLDAKLGICVAAASRVLAEVEKVEEAFEKEDTNERGQRRS